MYYNTTSTPPQRPGEHNSARIQFTETLLKKMAKDEIKNKTHLAAKAVKRSVARFINTPPSFTETHAFRKQPPLLAE